MNNPVVNVDYSGLGLKDILKSSVNGMITGAIGGAALMQMGIHFRNTADFSTKVFHFERVGVRK